MSGVFVHIRMVDGCNGLRFQCIGNFRGFLDMVVGLQ
jgi:hypothetical protein